MSDMWTPPKSYQTRPVVVLGGGVLGRRIACCWASAGYTVIIRDPSQKQLDDALQYIQENVQSFAAATGKTPGEAHGYQDLETAVKDAWLVFEAVPEHLQIKIDTFAQLEQLAPKDCILCSNSSSYKSGEMLEKVNADTKTRMLNTHYMMPPENRIVEMMTDGFTHKDIFPFLVERHKEAGLSPYVALKESTGFIFNRVWAAIKRECLTLLAEGVSTPDQLDAVWCEMYGGKAGPCYMMDAVGLDTVAFIEEHYVKERGLSPKNTVDFLQKNYLDQGKLGMKSSKGGFHPPPSKRANSASHSEEPKIVVLDVGLSQPLAGTGAAEIFNSGRVLEMSTDGKTVRTLVGKQNLPDGIDVCPDAKRLFWTNMGVPSKNDGSIMSSNIDGSDLKTIVAPGSIHTPKQLVVDCMSKKLYISDREGLRVWRCDFDGSSLEILVQTGDWKNTADSKDQTKWCVGMIAAPRYGKFYWTQKGAPKSGQGRIFSANIQMPEGQTPSDRKDITCLLDDLPEPIDLEIDDETNTLFWTDRGELPFGNTLNKVQLNDSGEFTASGSGPLKHDIIAQNFDEAIGLKLDTKSKTIYVSDMGGTLWKCNFDGSGKAKVYEDKSSAFTGLTLI